MLNFVQLNLPIYQSVVRVAESDKPPIKPIDGDIKTKVFHVM